MGHKAPLGKFPRGLFGTVFHVEYTFVKLFTDLIGMECVGICQGSDCLSEEA